MVCPIRVARHKKFIHHKQCNAGQEADQEIRRAQPPQAHAGRAHGGDFVVTRVIGERIKQGQQKRNRQHRHHEFRRHRKVILDDVKQVQFVLLKIRQTFEGVEGNPKHQKAAEAIRQRREQFAEQISVQQPHDAGRVSGGAWRGQVLSSRKTGLPDEAQNGSPAFARPRASRHGAADFALRSGPPGRNSQRRGE